MGSLSTTRLSSKGQVVIPEEVRDRLGLRPGARFVVVAERGVVILKTIEPPPLAEFDSLVAQAKRQARKAGITQKDVSKAGRRVRGRVAGSFDLDRWPKSLRKNRLSEEAARAIEEQVARRRPRRSI